MDFLYLILYACLRLLFLDVETNPGPRRPVPAICRILCSNVWGLDWNLSDLTMASSQHNILLCSETLDSDMSRVGVTGSRFRSPYCAGARCLGPEGWLHTYEMVTHLFRKSKFECGCCEMLIIRVCGVRQNLYVCVQSLPHPDLDDQIFYCLLASMAAVQAEDIRVNLYSTTTNSHGVAAFDFATVSCPTAEPMHIVEHLTS